MLIVTIFLASFFVYVPSAALAGVIIVSASSMFSWFEIKQIWLKTRTDIIPFGLTFLVCLYSSSLGIVVGIGVHGLMLLGRYLSPVDKVESKKEENCLILAGPLLYPSSEVNPSPCQNFKMSKMSKC